MAVNKRGRKCMRRVINVLVMTAFLQLLISFMYAVSPEYLNSLRSLLISRELVKSPGINHPEETPVPGNSSRPPWESRTNGTKRDSRQLPAKLAIRKEANDTKTHKEKIIPRKWPIPEGPGAVPKEWLALKDSNGQCSQCPFKERRGVFCLQEDDKPYTGRSGNTTCLLEGTHWNTTILRNNQKCACNIGWRGQACSVPDSVAGSHLTASQKNKLTLRDKPRRLINAFLFHMEFELLEARIAEYGDLVDVFLILESNFTAYGESKPLELLAKLQSGAFAEVACKIVYVFLDYFPHKAYYDGHLADRLHRDQIGVQGVGQQLRDFRNDDIFLLNDADEIPARETILFLKLHDGYPEPFGYHYHWTIYGFFWTRGKTSHVDTGMTMGMLIEAVGLDNTSDVKFFSSKLFRGWNSALGKYVKSLPEGSVYHWDFGNFTHAAGWHCSWCFPPKGIRDKLVSAQNGDFPRWGDRPEKLNLDYIESLVRKGMWFDDAMKFNREMRVWRKNYAPAHFMQNPGHYQQLLKNPYMNYTKHNFFLDDGAVVRAGDQKM